MNFMAPQNDKHRLCVCMFASIMLKRVVILEWPYFFFETKFQRMIQNGKRRRNKMSNICVIYVKEKDRQTSERSADRTTLRN